MSQRRSNRPAVTEEEDDPSLDRAINECVRYIFCREGSKIPFKRAEIAKHLNTTCQTNAGEVNSVISRANTILKRVYGYKLVQVLSKSGTQMIVILNKECESLPASVTDPLQRRILIAALTHIYMTGGPVKEDDMWKFLEEAGLLEETNHNGRKLLTHTFTKQMYLLYYKEGEGELARHVFEWGQRATEELPKLFILNKVAEAFGKTPEHWYEQYRGATEAMES
uniref:MAGE domain-containing protein n=1 Tax=Pectinophora gossypiella TaxID=13191 RepID=A0A1E1W4G7_PECGO